MDNHLTYRDFLLESKASQCALCGEIVPSRELHEVELDVVGGYEWVCAECRMGLERA